MKSIAEVFDLSGKGAVVTGGAAGIGKGIALRLAEAGASVVIADVNGAEAEKTATELRKAGRVAQAVQADVSKVVDATRMVKVCADRFGNIGVLVNDSLYYAGDSFEVPEGVDVQVLAVPAAAPWMKISEAMEYVLEVAPKRAFPTHEMLLSKAGKALSNARLGWATEQGGGEYLPLEPGDTIDL